MRGRALTSVSGSVDLALRMSTRPVFARLAGRWGDDASFCWCLLFLRLNYSSRRENCPSVSACPVCLNPTLNHAPFHVLLPTFSPRPSHFPATLATHIFLYPTWMCSSYLSLTSPLITLPLPVSPLFLLSLSIFDFHQTESRLSLTRASFHFISFDDNLSFPIRLPRSCALFPRQVPFLQ